MTMTLKYMIFAAVVLSDAIAGQVLIRRLSAEGKANIAPVLVGSLVVSTAAVGVILFKVL